jgi:hypothetical protein
MSGFLLRCTRPVMALKSPAAVSLEGLLTEVLRKIVRQCRTGTQDPK